MSSLAEVALEYIEVRGADYQVVVEVCPIHSWVTEVIPQDGEVGGIDYIVRVGVSTLLCAELLAARSATYSQGSAITGRRLADVPPALRRCRAGIPTK